MFPVDVEVDNLSTKTSFFNYVLVNGLSYLQIFNMNHIYLHPDMVWLYYPEYRVTNTKVLTIRGNHSTQYRIFQYPPLHVAAVSLIDQHLKPNRTQSRLVKFSDVVSLVGIYVIFIPLIKLSPQKVQISHKNRISSHGDTLVYRFDTQQNINTVTLFGGKIIL